MYLVKLSPSELKFNRATHKAVILAADVAALGAATTGTLALTASLAAGTVARCAGLDLVTAFDFSDAGITSLLIEIGDDGDTDRFLAQTQIAVDGTEILKASSALAAALVPANTIDAFFTVANGGTPLLSECNAGEVHIYLEINATLIAGRGIQGTLTQRGG